MVNRDDVKRSCAPDRRLRAGGRLWLTQLRDDLARHQVDAEVVRFAALDAGPSARRAAMGGDLRTQLRHRVPPEDLLVLSTPVWARTGPRPRH